MTEKQMKVLRTAYANWMKMEDRKLANRMSIVDFNMIYLVMQEMYKDSKVHAETISWNVADWFCHNGFNVQECGVGWIINLP